MKNLITIIIMLVAVGCGKSAAERLEEENKNLKADLENRKLMSKLAEDAVGSYERKNEGKTVKIVFRKKGWGGVYKDGEMEDEGRWIVEAMVAGLKPLRFKNEVRYGKWDGQLRNQPDYVAVYIIETNGDLIEIAQIKDGKRTDIPKDKQATFKKFNLHSLLNH